MSGYTLSSTTVHNAEGWKVETKSVNIFTAKGGAMTAPVFFHFDSGKTVQPYFISPWQDENKFGMGNDCLKNLRGEFFCLPFGGNGDPVNGVTFPCHGETATAKWSCKSAERTGSKVQLVLEMKLSLTEGEVQKKITLDDDQEAVYIEHVVSGLEGDFPIGHHAILNYPDPDEKMYLAADRFDLGMVHPGIFSDPVNKEFQCLLPGAEFDDLTKVPSMFKSPDTIDCTTYPMPVGYTDIFAMFRKPADTPAWTAVVFPERGYIWYALKDSAVLPGTAIWNANQGRYGEPWNGRTSCIGIEDCCSFFACGYKPSIEENELTGRNWKSAFRFSKDAPSSIKVIQGIARIPENFGRITATKFTADGIEFTGCSGITVSAKVDWKFVK
jgi:hypothetical protein